MTFMYHTAKLKVDLLVPKAEMTPKGDEEACTREK